jgi:hypothetical protein
MLYPFPWVKKTRFDKKYFQKLAIYELERNGNSKIVLTWVSN